MTSPVGLDVYYSEVIDYISGLAAETGHTYYDYSTGAHVPDYSPCEFCAKIYARIDGHRRVFCAGCGEEFANPKADRAHRCQRRRKLKRALFLKMMPWGTPKRLPRRKKKAIKKANGGKIPKMWWEM